MKDFKLPDLGEGIKEGQVLRLLVAQGEPIDEDQLLMEVETDKSAVEIPSPVTGIVERWHVSENETVNVGDLLVTFGERDGASPTPTVVKRAASSVSSAAPPTSTAATAVPAGAAPRPGARTPASPAVRKLARTLRVDLETVAATGPGGRVLRVDVENAANGTASVAAPASPAPMPPITSSPPVTPGTQPTPTPEGRDDHDGIGPVKRVPMSRTRQAIARAMSHAASTIPHVTDTEDADVTELDRLRRGYNESVPPERKLGLLPFVVRAVARALQIHPIFNASLSEDASEIIYKTYCNVAVGVQTERGLVAPVLRDAEQQRVPDIAVALEALAEGARRGTLSLDQTRGATYTISNAGAMGGSRYSTPIITHPQVAVLAVGRSRQRPWVVDGELVPRLIMPLSHSIDHRLIDGAVEIAFLRHIVGDLENPARLML